MSGFKEQSFKVGDRVKLRGECFVENSHSLDYDCEGVVRAINGEVLDVRVKWDKGGVSWWYDEGVLEHALTESLTTSTKPFNILVIGKARHGKDTFCELLRDSYGYSFESSSMQIIKEFLPTFEQLFGYTSAEEAYNNREGYRDLLFQLVSCYNSKDLTRMAKKVLETNDIYCGMRKYEELEACIEAGLFDLIVWVDAEERLGDTEGESSCTVTQSQADIIISNNDTQEEFEDKVTRLMKVVGGGL